MSARRKPQNCLRIKRRSNRRRARRHTTVSGSSCRASFELRNGGQMIQRRLLPWARGVAHAKGNASRRIRVSKKAMARVVAVVAVLVVLSVTLTARTASAASFVVKPPNLQGWSQQNYDNGTASNTTSTTTSG